MIREYVTFMNAAEKWDEAYEMLIKYKARSKCLIIIYKDEHVWVYYIPYIENKWSLKTPLFMDHKN